MKSYLNFLIKVLLTLVIITWSSRMYSKEVDLNTAKKVALNLCTERAENNLPGLRIDRVIEEQENGKTVFYVIIFSEKGFAIISADDIIQPVLGYSFNSCYNENNIPPVFEEFILERFRKEIYTASDEKINPNEKTKSDWAKYAVAPGLFQPKSVKAMDPLLTSTWRQSWPYNAHCPADPAGPGGHALVGCVATAMAQLMNFWQHPWHGTGSHSYTPEDHPEYGLQTADFENTYYNFDSMPDVAVSYIEDLAELNYHCAVSVDMNFGPDASGAWGDGSDDLSSALKDYFYYSDDCEDISRYWYSDPDWIDILKNNINSGQPVIYGSSNSATGGGHAWVMDGVTDDDMFNCNWGWGGSNDGLYSIDDLTPGTNNYNLNHHACVNIKPKTGSLSGTLTAAGSPYIYNFDHYIESNQQLTIEPGVDIIFNGRYKFIVEGQLNAEGYNGGFIWFNAQVPEIGMQGVMFSDLNLNLMDSSKLSYCRFENGKGSWEPIFRLSNGGGIFCRNSSKILIERTSIFNSSADYGGGISCIDSSGIRLHHSYIDDDSSTFYGGGIYIDNSDVVFTENHIDGNQTTGTLGMYSSGGGIYCRNSNVTFFKDVIENNYAYTVGGIGFDSCEVTLDSVIINDNSSYGLAGGIFATSESDITLNACQIFNNSANHEGGGGLYIHDNSSLDMNYTLIHNNYALYAPAVALLSNSTALLNKCTLAENLKDPPSSINGITVSASSYLFIKNSILWDNGSNEISIDPASSVNVLYSTIENGNWPGTGVSSKDPLFTYPYSEDFSLSWDDYPENWEKSPCIDTGDPSSPDDPDGTRVDMGVFPFEQLYTPLSGGDVSGTLLCSESPYHVMGDITVPVGDELIIEPCVYLVFMGEYSLTVNGRLLAEGTETDKIGFIPGDTVTGWQGIRFFDSNTNGQDSSKLAHCRIKYGNAKGYGYEAYGGGVYFNNSADVLIDNCLFYGNQAETSGGGMFLTNHSSPVVRNSTFTGNTALNGGAICCYDNVNTYFLNCFFSNNTAEYGGAIVVSSCAPGFSGSTMKNNHATKFGGAIYHTGGQEPTFDPENRCDIFDNYAAYAGLDFYTAADVYLPPVLDVYLDTASVALMDDHFAYPLQYFNLISDNAKFIQEKFDLYISTTGSDMNSGTSPSYPLKTIKMALIKIIAEESNPRTIHIAEGTYSALLTGEMLPINHKSHITLAGESKANTRLEGDTLHRILVSYADRNDSIKNLTFQHGHYEGDGGAIVIENNSNPTFYDVAIQNNSCSNDGGAVWCFDECNPIFSTVYFIYNNSGNSGGALYFQDNDTIIMENCFLSTNTSLYSGGGIYAAYNDYCLLYKGFIVFNELSNGGGGGATFRQGPVSLQGLWINGNSVIGSGGGLFTDYSVDLEIKDCTFSYNNASGEGGGFYFYHGVNVNMEDVSFFSNSSVEGGGIWGYYGSSLNINNGLFYNNNTLYDPYSSGEGGAMRLANVNTDLMNVTISYNQSDGDGGGLYCWASDVGVNYSVQNSIIYGNHPDQINVDYLASVDVNYCDVEDGWSPGVGNINADPDFVEAGTSNFHLNPGSPCINAGNPDTTGMNLPLFDLAGDPRISLDTLDMGAYEFFAGIELDLKAFLEGPYNGTTMNTLLSGFSDPEFSGEEFPLQQPYNSPPWNYPGAEEVTVLPFDNIVDWMLIEVRDTTIVSLASPESISGQQAVFLLEDGSLVDINGNNIRFGNPVEHQCYIAIYHRNHLEVISAYPLTELGGIFTYDFTTPAGQAHGTNSQKDLGGGVFGMYGGDADANGTIELDDKTLFWSLEAGRNGYLNSDFNLDSQTDNKDKNDLWILNVGEESQVPE